MTNNVPRLIVASTDDPFLGEDYCQHVLSTLSTNNSQQVTIDAKNKDDLSIEEPNDVKYEDGHVISLVKGGHVGFIKHNEIVCQSIMNLIK